MLITSTNLDEQISAVEIMANRNNDPALHDAAVTLTKIKRISAECHRSAPDADKIAAFLVELAVGS
jgi:hypothetical protein